MKKKLTDKQLAVYCFMQDFFRENDQLPPNKALSEHFGWVGAQTGNYHTRVLEKSGYLEKNSVGRYRFAREGK